MAAPEPGTRVERTRTLTQGEFDLFARLSGDDNPIHVDPEYSARTRFGRTAAHGMLLYSLLCGVMQEIVPDGVQVSQELMFPAPTFAGDEMRFAAEVAAVDGRVVRLDLEITNPDGAVTCTGAALVEVSG